MLYALALYLEHLELNKVISSRCVLRRPADGRADEQHRGGAAGGGQSQRRGAEGHGLKTINQTLHDPWALRYIPSWAASFARNV